MKRYLSVTDPKDNAISIPCPWWIKEVGDLQQKRASDVSSCERMRSACLKFVLTSSRGGSACRVHQLASNFRQRDCEATRGPGDVPT